MALSVKNDHKNIPIFVKKIVRLKTNKRKSGKRENMKTVIAHVLSKNIISKSSRCRAMSCVSDFPETGDNVLQKLGLSI